ncbi:MAG: hypothetical protein LUH17_09535 [Acidaminococcaceae bacterium]|nr:hypothetical protein [Acidaminococcaceae bacterium]
MARFGDRLKINYDIDDTAFFKVPALILQPIIENSVKHGLHPKLDGGTITITVKNCSDYFFIAVHDDGIGIPRRQNWILCCRTLLTVNRSVSSILTNACWQSMVLTTACG